MISQKWCFFFVIGLTGCQISTTSPPTSEIPTTPTSDIDPANFVSAINHPYFSLKPGLKFVYEGDTEDGIERTETLVTDRSKVVMGVPCVVVWDRVWLDSQLIEDTKDWYAQDKDGNVWYFGEDSKEIAGGKVTSTHGSWEAGKDLANTGTIAKPGIIMKASPQVGDDYAQEYYPGVAEDRATVVDTNASITLSNGKNYTGCLKTKDYTTLEPDADEYKYYCSGLFSEIGNIIAEETIQGTEKIEFVEVLTGQSAEGIDDPIPVATPKFTAEDAKQAALKHVPGTVTHVGMEHKSEHGMSVWVVEIRAEDGTETDVHIHPETGEVLKIEK